MRPVVQPEHRSEGGRLAGETPSALLHTNPAQPVSDARFAPPGSLLFPRIPPELADHPQYRIIDRLGEGGMGVVFKAEHRMMGRTVALKVLAPHLTIDPEAAERFLKEVAAAGRLSHPNIVIAHDAGAAGGLHFLVMEFVEGISLDRLVAKRGPLAVALACHFARQAALGLQHAFEKGMVHRDIKPPNLMVTRKGQVKVLDFGLARLALDAEAGRAPTTSPSLLMGTPDFISPEQARNPHDVDIRSDLYSLGCTLYALLSGRPPFARSTTLIDKLLAHTEEQPEPLATYRQDVPDGLVAVLGKLMAKRPEDRYATPAEAAAALAPFAKGQEPPAGASVAPAPVAFEVIEAPEPAPILPVVDFRFTGDADETRLIKPRKKRRRSKARNYRGWIAGGIGVLLVGLAIGIAAKGTRKPPPRAGSNQETVDAKPAPTVDSSAARKPPLAAPAAKLDASILIVLPSFDLAMDDFTAVRQRLESASVRVFTASGPPSFGPRSAFRPDYLLKPEMDVSAFRALIFVGRDPYEFTRPQSGGAFAAQTAIEKMQNQSGVIGAIGGGEATLALHGVLNGKAAALHAPTRALPAVESLPIRWENQGVVIEGKLVTAAAPTDAMAFADAIVKLLR